MYIELGNATDAYKKAGYKAKGKSIEVNASKLLRNPKVKLYIEERMELHQQKSVASQEEVLQFLTSILRNEVTEQVPLGVGDGAQTLEEKEMSAKDRIKAAELLGKRYALFTDNQNLNVEAQVVFKENIKD